MKSLVSLSERDVGVCIKLSGQARVDTAALLMEQLAGFQHSKDVLPDWEEVEHVDASVLQVLLALNQQLEAAGRRLRVQIDNPHVREHLQVAGLAEFFPFTGQQLSDSRESAHV